MFLKVGIAGLALGAGTVSDQEILQLQIIQVQLLHPLDDVFHIQRRALQSDLARVQPLDRSTCLRIWFTH